MWVRAYTCVYVIVFIVNVQFDRFTILSISCSAIDLSHEEKYENNKTDNVLKFCSGNSKL